MRHDGERRELEKIYFFHQIPTSLQFKVSTESTDSKMSSNIILQKLREESAIYCMNRHIGNLPRVRLSRKTQIYCLPVQQQQKPISHNRSNSFPISSAQNKAANILFYKNSNYKKCFTQHMSYPINSIPRDLAVSASGIQSGFNELPLISG